MSAVPRTPRTDPARKGAFASAAQLRALFALPRLYFNPVFLGLDELNPTKPALFVGNHTLYGVLDTPLLVEHLYTRYGVLLRGLADRAHFKVPGWSKLIERGGTVLGTPGNCAALMQQRASILVFPGGGREVMQRKGESYHLVWKNRTGFARMAIEYGYDIIPFGSVGPDETYRILWDANDVMATRLWRWIASVPGLVALSRDGDLIPPISLGLGYTPLPRPQRFYFGFGKRIRTTKLHGRERDPKTLWQLREKVAAAIEGQIHRLQRYRTTDQERNWSPLRRRLA
jgi:1-acyl-sn-glycerol-3-phosphate acyltransferase